MTRNSPRTCSAARNLSIVFVCLGLLAAAPAQGQDTRSDVPSKSSSKFLASFREPVAKARQSTVKILCEGKVVALGTVVRPDGWVLTKASELKGAPVCKIGDNKQLEGKVIGIHEIYDLALLKIEAHGLTPVEWRDSKQVPVGSWLATAGTGVEPLAAGVVSAPTRTLSVFEAGPTKRPPGGFLGINMMPAEQGSKISGLLPDSPAGKAGLRLDDLIVALDGKATSKPEVLQQTLQKCKPGDVISVKIKRGEKEMELKVKLDRRPIGNPGDRTSTLGGKLSDRRSGFTAVLSHDTALRPEDCGGPVVDLDGKVVGINIARAARVETIAIPAEAVQSVLADLMSGKLTPRETVETTVAKPPTPEEKVAKAKAALKQAETDKAVTEKKLAETRAALEKAEAEAKAAKKSAAK